jgi:predicted DNA-binding transcriptional regulator YafY
VIIPSNRTQIDGAVFSNIFYAWQNHKVCHVGYKDSKGRISERDFEPHALIFFDGVWYAKGFCRVRNEMRTLVVPRITTISVSNEDFEPDPAIIKTANEEGIFDPEMVKNVVVQCDEYLANIIQTRPLHPEQEIIPNAVGCEVWVKKMSKYKLITWVMHQCGRAYIVQPEIVRDDIFTFATELMVLHKKNGGTK